MFKRPSVCVVIPCHHADLAAYEMVSLTRCLAVLGKYPLVLVTPANRKLDALLSRFPELQQQGFEDSYFENVASYNRLMLSDDFYARFSDYDYVLIHQLDAFVFSDQLAAWCYRGYDYVGAPWLPDDAMPTRRRDLQMLFNRFLLRRSDGATSLSRFIHISEYMYFVGNGGFSLRRVSAMRAALAAFQGQIAQHLSAGHPLINEDIFFGIEAPKVLRHLRIPGFRKAAAFSWELKPNLAAALNHGRLPFGCHGWNKLHRDDWRPTFARLGYSLDEILSQ